MTDIFLIGVMCSGIIAGTLLFTKVNAPEKFVMLAPIRWFGLAFVIFHVLVPLDILLTGPQYAEASDLAKMSFVGLFTGVGYLTGWLLSERYGITHSEAIVEKDYSTRKLQTLGAIAFTLGITGIFVTIIKCGGLKSVLYKEVLLLDAMGMSYHNVVNLLVAQFVTVIGIISHLVIRHRRAITLKLAMALCTILFISVSMKIGSRTRILYGVLPALVLLGLFDTKTKVLIWLLTAVLILPTTMIFARVRGGRYSLKDQVIMIVSGQDSDDAAYPSILDAPEFDAFENGAQLVAVVDQTGNFFYGKTFLSALVNPIPRLLWPNKPAIDPASILREAGVGKGAYEAANIAISLAGECYANLWWPGAFVIPLILGYVSSRVWRKLILERNPVFRMIIMSSFAVFSAVVCRGAFTIMFTITLMVIVFPCMCIVLDNYKGLHRDRGQTVSLRRSFTNNFR